MSEHERDFRLHEVEEPIPTAGHAAHPAENCHTWIERDPRKGTYSGNQVGYDLDLAKAILDQAFVCHVAYRAPASAYPGGGCLPGHPVVLPKVFGRDGDMLYFHGSPKSRMHRHFRTAEPDPDPWVCVNVTLVDGICVGRAASRSGIDYRSVMVHGEVFPVSRKRKKTALEAITEHVVRGRSRDSRPADPVELDFVAVMGLKLENVSTKVACGDPHDAPEDVAANRYWAGTLPVGQVFGRPFPARNLPADKRVPDYLAHQNEFRQYRPVHPPC
ncbi:pyridoxamine 5'-phosphate oxidase family protein [Streptomyces sp. URMC 129]|uniref:pyridoxamine 5'-phosphate oxidase family protein n=1 Tax=Streptomyces sp. URMC 129 TaxID=3423407 RepID=UPI003F1B6D81